MLSVCVAIVFALTIVVAVAVNRRRARRQQLRESLPPQTQPDAVYMNPIHVHVDTDSTGPSMYYEEPIEAGVYEKPIEAGAPRLDSEMYVTRNRDRQDSDDECYAVPMLRFSTKPQDFRGHGNVVDASQYRVLQRNGLTESDEETI